jgi:hypothetical protein
MGMDTYVIFATAIAIAVLVWWWHRSRATPPNTQPEAADRLDTLIGWPPEATRILRNSERLAYSTLKLALPGYMILAQVPISRFINVPKRNSYAEWMRRLGSQCVDFAVCDVTSQVVAVIDVRPPDSQISERLRRRLDRVARALKAVNIPLHVWNEESLPSVEAARASIVPAAPAVPADIASRRAAATSAAETAAALAQMRNAFEDTDRDPDRDDAQFVEVIEMQEPRSSTWFDELDSESSNLPPPTRKAR